MAIRGFVFQLQTFLSCFFTSFGVANSLSLYYVLSNMCEKLNCAECDCSKSVDSAFHQKNEMFFVDENTSEIAFKLKGFSVN